MTKYLIINSHIPVFESLAEALKHASPAGSLGGLDKATPWPEGQAKTLVIEIGAVTVVEPAIKTREGDDSAFTNTPAFRADAEMRMRDQCGEKQEADCVKPYPPRAGQMNTGYRPKY